MFQAPFRTIRHIAAIGFFSVSTISLVATQAYAQPSVSLTLQFGAEAFAEPFSGDVFVALSQRGEPRKSMHQWFGAPPLARFRVEKVAPGGTVTLDLNAAEARHPLDWGKVAGEEWQLQAVARVNSITRQAGDGAGDVYSDVVSMQLSDGASVNFNLDHVVTPEPFKETDRIRLFAMESPSLTKFFGTSYQIQAGVLLPRDYDPSEKYPVVYDIPGFGGTHRGIQRMLSRLSEDSYLQQCIVVIPDPSNRYGHSVFCNSRSIGPWGDALVRDMIPKLEMEFGGAGAEHRYVTGVSSGGWSCLYLQVTYPAEFAGCWSHVPDPIDFHDFQQINLYEPLPSGEARNMYTDENGSPRPLARRGTVVMLTYEDFVRREHVTNPGGQIRSFEATFSKPDKAGEPQRVFDVETGRVDHTVAQTWRPYDLSHQLLTNWDDLQPELAGKIHIFAGELDTFYLNGAVERFEQLAGKAGMLQDIEVKVVPGMAHSLYRPGQKQMLETIANRFEAVTP
ncbi:MAG TPA: hypothetical protein DDW52_16165 [Planctomycetaceae bacterium]|nr:hypothetical protein [Planctomycetaceae bacterium]